MGFLSPRVRRSAILLVLGVALAIPAQTLAAGPFGGQIQDIKFCAVPPGAQLLKIGPPRGGSFLYIPGASRLYLYGVIRSGAWTLGLSGAEAGCFILVSVRRRSFFQLIGMGAKILFMGTSR